MAQRLGRRRADRRHADGYDLQGRLRSAAAGVAMNPSFRMQECDLADGNRLDEARALMLAGQLEGAIPLDRPELTGVEDAFFARDNSTGEAVGVAVYYLPEGFDHLWLDILYVVPRCRRQLIGSALVDAVMRVAKHRGFPKVEFGTMLTNETMQRFARHEGFDKGVVYMSKATA
ncbi:MAG: GNAT family N-acetyltransferase [Mesorhizobium sp.]|nr:MAG: GNAT family N-acetyltransferase [Mesorhizobium sp.]